MVYSNLSKGNAIHVYVCRFYFTLLQSDTCPFASSYAKTFVVFLSFSTKFQIIYISWGYLQIVVIQKISPVT